MANVKKLANKKVEPQAKTKSTQPRVAANGYRLPDPIPAGEILIDNSKTEWLIGESIGCGGFGEIYAAKKKAEVKSDYEYVIKVDHLSGPLYAEMHFYLRVAKEEEINKWMENKGLKFLGLPRYISFGIHERQPQPTKGRKKKNEPTTPIKYRFLVMQRFGEDLQKILKSNNNKFPIKTAYKLAIKIIDILEYIHHHGYIHADIKASNLLLIRNPSSSKKVTKNSSKQYSTEVFLVDYGLVERYMSREGEHKPYGEDLRRANNGTTEFSSRDAHIGAFSRRGDLEVLAFNVLSWISGGRLPWLSNLKDHKYVRECKEYYMSKIHELVNYCFASDSELSPSKNHANGFSSHDTHSIDISSPLSSTSNSKRKPILDRKKLSPNVPIGIVEVFQYIVNLDYEEKPDYHLFKKIFESSIEKLGGKLNDQYISFDSSFEEEKPKSNRRPLTIVKQSPQKGKHSLNDDEDHNEKDKKRVKITSKQTSTLQNEKDEKLKSKRSKTHGDNSNDLVKNNNNHNTCDHLTPTPQMLDVMRKQAARNRATRRQVNKNSSNRRSASTSTYSPRRSKSISPTANYKATSPFDRPTPQMLELMKKLKQKKSAKRLS